MNKEINLNGWLLIDKPLEWTSFDAVNKVRGTIAQKFSVKSRSIKVGHTGTLDPLATGLLVLAVGKATKQIQQQIKVDKSYSATMKLGATSSTGDREGELTVVSDRRPTKEEVGKALDSFVGSVEQIPPRYSALKVGGVAAYKRARRGEQFELKPRQVEIYTAKLLSYDYPNISFECQVSSGTYIRSLVEDLGKELDCGAHLSQLRRTTVGSFSIDDSISPEAISFEQIEKRLISLDLQG